MTTSLVIVVLLAAPVFALFGVVAGAILTYRLLKGLPPVTLPRLSGKKIQTVTEAPPPAGRTLPTPRA